MEQPSRREFLYLSAGGLLSAPSLFAAQPANTLTVQEFAAHIRAELGGEWDTASVDGFKAGDPSVRLTGVLTTALASIEVLRTAVERRCNMIITCEPTYYAKADSPTPPVRRGPGAPPPSDAASAPPDPVFTAKQAFLRDHNLAIFRMGEHWRTRTPDPFARGLADVLGSSGSASKDATDRITVPETSLEALVSRLNNGLRSRGGIRVVGDPKMRIQTVGILPGSTPIQNSLQLLPHVDVIVAGEVREWESVEYVRDTAALGGKKALILLGRIQSEEPGMKICAQWLQTISPRLNTSWCSAGDPYWRPGA